MAMTLEQAASYYLDINHPPTGDLCADLLTAGTIAARWRRVGEQATATILHALRDHCGMTERHIESRTGIPQTTVNRLINRLLSGYYDGNDSVAGGTHDSSASF